MQPGLEEEEDAPTGVRPMSGLTIWAQVFGVALVLGGIAKLLGMLEFDANGVVLIIVGGVMVLVGNALKPL